MKKLLLISSLLFTASMMFGQSTINYSGSLTNNPANGVMVFLEVDSVIIDSTLTNPTTGNYSGTVAVPSNPFMIRILFLDCNGVYISDFHSPAPNLAVHQVAFTTLNYCSASPCNAMYNKFQATTPGGTPIPNQVVLVNASTGTNLTYSWDFGDGSAPLLGLNVTHTYANNGFYNVCLTVSSNNAGVLCTNTYCDTLSVDAAGIIRSGFTVTTGSTALSIKEAKTINSVNVYPNPAQEMVTVDFESINSTEVLVKIMDAKGAQIQMIERSIFSGTNKIELNTSGLKEGIYVIQLIDGESFVTKRLQIVR